MVLPDFLAFSTLLLDFNRTELVFVRVVFRFFFLGRVFCFCFCFFCFFVSTWMDGVGEWRGRKGIFPFRRIEVAKVTM